MRIDLRQFTEQLGLIDLPYNVRQQPPFRLPPCIDSIEYKRGSETKVLTASTQLHAFETSVLSFADAESQGWTMCIAGQAHLGFTETAAAFLLGAAAKSDLNIAWVDCREAFKANAYDIWSLPSIVTSNRTPHVAVFTALLPDTPDARWSRVTDLMRSTTRSMSRIVVGTGMSPVDIMRRLGLPFQRALNMRPASHDMG